MADGDPGAPPGTVTVPDLDPLLHQRTRLRIMALMHRNRQANFTWVQEALELTPGNLGSHVEKLVTAGLLEKGRVLTRDGFEVRVRMTPEGDEAFRAYLGALGEVLEGTDGGEG